MNLSTVLDILTIVLAGGTIFAWYQFAVILIKKKDSCAVCVPGGNCESVHPFRSKCFIGAVFFTIALALSVYAVMLI
jgi:hypothetical protein